MTPIYLDNNATTAIHPEVAAAMDECQRAGLGNPASQHSAGRRARRILEEARVGIAEILGARMSGMDADQIVFTSGGTEANNLALRGLASQTSQRIIISAIEHPSLMGAAQKMAESGHEVVRLPVDPNGVVRIRDLETLLEKPTHLVSVMLGNNETGVLQPIHQAAAVCRRFGVLIHTDAVQCVGKIPVHFAELDVDAMTVSAHKFHGPVGIGALVIRHGVALDPLLVGGFQQSGIRPGTESVPLIVGMHRALQIWQSESQQRSDRLLKLRTQFEETLQRDGGIVVNGATSERLPHTSNVAFLGLDRQALVMAFDMANIACSTGSACASGSSEPSPVLLAMGAPQEVIQGSIRFSFSAFTTEIDIAQACHRISCIVSDLRRKRFSQTEAATPPKSRPAPV